MGAVGETFWGRLRNVVVSYVSVVAVVVSLSLSTNRRV